MVTSKVNFSVKNLEKLLKDEHSCVHLKKFKKHLSLDPSELADTKGSIRTNLNKLISKYDSEMDGVVLGFRRMKVTSSLGKILNDNPHIHFDVEAEFFIFRPEIGCTLTGIVKKMNNDCIGCLVHDIFNVTIPFEYNNNIDQEDIYCGQQRTFVVDFVDFTSSLPYIKGKLVGSLENFTSSQSLDVESPGSYVMTQKMKKRKTKLYSQSSVGNKSIEEDVLTNELGESDNEDVNDWKNEEVLSFSGKNVTPKHPISILKKEKAENTPSKRISFYGDIPSSLETLEKEQSTGHIEELSKVKKARKKAKSNLETKPESQGMVDSKKTKREKKERMMPEIDMSDFPQSQLTYMNEMEIVSEDPLTESPTKKKKKKKKSGLNTSVFHDNTQSDIDLKEDEEHKSENVDSISFGPREKKGKKIKHKDKDFLEPIELRGMGNNDGVKSKKHKSSTEILDFPSSTPAKLNSQTNLEKTTKKDLLIVSVGSVEKNNKEIKSKKRKIPSELLDIPTATESLKVNDQNTSVFVKSKKLKTLSGPSLIDSCKEAVDLDELNCDGMQLKKRKRASELLGTTLITGVDLENNTLEVSNELSDKKLETKRIDSLINLRNEKDKSSNSPKKKKKKREKVEAGFENKDEVNDLMQINRNKVVSNENSSSECIGEKKSITSRKGIGFSSFRTEKSNPFANSTVIAPSLSEIKNTSCSSIGNNLFDLPSPIKIAENDAEMLDEMGFITSTQIDPEDYVFDKALSNIDRRQKVSTIIEPDKSTNTNLKLPEKVQTKGNVSKPSDKGQPFKTSVQSKSPSKTKSAIDIKDNRDSKLSDAGATGNKKVTPGRLGKKLLTSLLELQNVKSSEKTKSESELDISDPDLPSHFKNMTTLPTNLGMKFKSAADTKERDADKDTAAVSSMKTGALETGANSPQKKGKKVFEHSDIALKSELGGYNAGRHSNTPQKLKKRKSSAEGISTNLIMPKEGSKKSMDNDGEESKSEDIVPSLEKLSKTLGKSNKLKKQSKKVQSKEEKSLSFSPENLSSLADELLKNI